MKRIAILIVLSLTATLGVQAQSLEMVSEIKQKTSYYNNWYMGSTEESMYFYNSDKDGVGGKVLVYNRSYQFQREIILSEDWAPYTEALVVDDKTFVMLYTFRKNSSGNSSTRLHIYNTKGKKIEDREYEDASVSNFSMSPNDKYIAYKENDGDKVIVISTEDFKEVAEYENYEYYGTVNNDGSYIQLGFEQKLEEGDEDDEEEDLDEIDDLNKPFIAFNKDGEDEQRVNFEIEEEFPHRHDFYYLRKLNKIAFVYFFGDEKETVIPFGGFSYTINYYSSEGMGVVIIDAETRKIETRYSIEFSEEDMLFKDRTENNNRFGGVEYLYMADIELIDGDVYVTTQSRYPFEFSEEISEEETKSIHGIMIKFDDEGNHKQRLLQSETDKKGEEYWGYPGFRIYNTGDDRVTVAFGSDIAKKTTIMSYVFDDELELKETRVQDFGGQFKYNLSMFRAIKVTGKDNEFMLYGHKKKNKNFAIFRMIMD